MLFFGVCFFLYFIELSAGNGFWTKFSHLTALYSIFHSGFSYSVLHMTRILLPW